MQACVRPLAALSLYWCLFCGLAIDFYATRYEDDRSALLPYGAIAALAAALLIAGGLRARGAREATALVLCVSLVLVAAAHPLQGLHLVLVAALLFSVLAALSLLSAAGLPRKLLRLAVALLLGSLNFVLLAYYAVLILGREGWNQIVSRRLLVDYLAQLPELVSAIPVPAWIPYSAALGLFCAFLAAYWAVSAALADAVAALSPLARAGVDAGRARGRRAAAAAIGAAVLACGIVVYRGGAAGVLPDPLLTTFLAEQWGPGTPFMAWQPSAEWLRRDREVAASYGADPVLLRRKTLVLVTVDSLRADQMHVYGHARDNTPFLSGLYREGRLARFENAFSICAESFCGLLGIQASRFQHQLGTSNFSLADALKRLGYRVHFYLGGNHAGYYGLRSYYGWNIDDYRDGASIRGYMNDDVAVADWIAQMPASGDAPLFLYVHLMSTHVLGKRSPEFRRWYRTAEGEPLGDYANNYHDGILQADAILAAIFRSLSAKGMLDDALVAITADHGEMLGEEGRYGHAGELIDAVVRVPLLIYDSERFPYPPRQLSSVVDIAPTLLDRIGAPVPSHWQGNSLARTAARRTALMQSGNRYALAALLEGGLYKYYYDARTGSERLFHLSQASGGAALQDTGHDDIRRALRAELEEQVPALRRPVP